MPAGVAGGETVAFVGPDGKLLEVVVPVGLSADMTFLAEVPSASSAPAASLVQDFSEWCERERVEDTFDAFIEANAHKLHAVGLDGEQSLASYALFQEYQALFDGALQRMRCALGNVTLCSPVFWPLGARPPSLIACAPRRLLARSRRQR